MDSSRLDGRMGVIAALFFPNTPRKKNLVDPHQAKLSPNCFDLNSFFASIPLPLFWGATFDRIFPFFKHASLLKAKIFPHLKALSCISASSLRPSKEPPDDKCMFLFIFHYVFVLFLKIFCI